jgi:RNA polymerase sigma-70 factor (sigma-E family)
LVSADRDVEYSEFVLARQRQLRRMAFLVCGDWHLAEDVLQTALIKLYAAWPRLHHDGREEAYVRQIIVRTNIDEHRRPRRREVLGLPPEIGHAPAGTPYQERSELFTALQDLPPMLRKTVVLRHWLGLSVEETATELGIATGTVKAYSSRAIEKLEAALAPRTGQ